jgi:hypothetical protein
MNVGFEALTVITMNMTVFWYVTPCGLEYRYQCLEELLPLPSEAEDAGKHVPLQCRL